MHNLPIGDVASRQQLPDDCGILLVGHGSREVTGTDEFLETARLVAGKVEGVPVEPCFLEFAEPTIPEGFRRLVARGVRRVVVSPVLLFSAGHAKRDIPVAVAAAAAEFPGVEVRQAAHLGCEANLLALSQQRYQEAIAGAQPVAGVDWLVIVGRGSLDDGATSEMRRFAALRGDLLPGVEVEVGFVAMAVPKLTDVFDSVAASNAARIVVQPHLLFGGVLLDRIGTTVANYAKRYPRPQWVTTKHLGPVSQLADAILSQVRLTLSQWVES